MNTQLLCTFTDTNSLQPTIDLIVECNDIMYNKIYVLSNTDDSSQLMCTYNIPKTDDFLQGAKNTISLHRKKQSNTLYTINALNMLIENLTMVYWIRALVLIGIITKIVYYFTTLQRKFNV